MSISRAGAGLAAVALSGLAVLGMQSAASAAPGDCPVGQIYAPVAGCTAADASVNHFEFPPGGSGLLHGEGFLGLSTVTVWADSDIYMTSTKANTAGIVDVQVTLPSLSLGAHSLVMKGTGADGQPLVLSVPIEVVSSTSGTSTGSSGSSGGTTTSGSSLPRTGFEVGLVAAAGIVLIGAGTGAVYAGRRRLPA